MIYVIGLIVVAAIAFVLWKSHKTVMCKCDKCTDENCKCDENKCDDNCKCHDVAEAPVPYLNGHSKKITADPADEPTDSCDTAGHEPCDTCTDDEPKAAEAPKEEPKKEEPKKEQPKKKPAPKPKKKGKGKK